MVIVGLGAYFDDGDFVLVQDFMWVVGSVADRRSDGGAAKICRHSSVSDLG